jgi:flagella basal body P-ring formation protein FlgA
MGTIMTKAIHLLAIALALALPSTASAAPLLRADITVLAPVVTVGDMFDDAGALAEKALFRAPLPGTTGNVDLAALRTAAARIGLVSFEANGLSQVRVSRAANLVDENLNARDIVTPGMRVDTLFSRPIDPLQVEVSDFPARLDNLRYFPGNGSFSARFILAGHKQPLDVSGTMEMSVEVPHLAASLPAGTILAPEHIVMRGVSIRQADAAAPANIDQLVGKSLNRQSREGMLLRAGDVSTPLAVAKNELVTIYYRQGPLTLTVKGQAITGAARGAPLQVLNLSSRRAVSAIAVAPGAVEVSTSAMTLAGL